MSDDKSAIPLSCKIIQSGSFKGWIEMPPFAILDEHTYYETRDRKDNLGNTLHGIDGKPEKEVYPVHLTPDELKRIAHVSQKRIIETGDYSPIAVGHTEDGMPAKFQPEIVGFAKDFLVQPFINPDTGADTGRLAIYATPFCKAEDLHHFLDNPRRSVELWFEDGVIDPLSILGPETPARDLGLHKFSKSNKYSGSSYSYSITNPNPKRMSMADENIKPDDLDGDAEKQSNQMKESDWVKELSAKVDKLVSMFEKLIGGDDGQDQAPDLEGDINKAPEDAQAQGQDGQGGDDYDDLLGPADQGGDGQNPADFYSDHDLGIAPQGGAPQGGAPQDDELHGQPHKSGAYGEPHQAMAYSAPGVGNVKPPSGGNRQMSKKTDDFISDPVKFAKDAQEKAKFAKLEQAIQAKDADINALKEKIGALELRNETAECLTLLSALNAEGVGYDPAMELPALVKMSKEDRTKRLDYIRKYHEKSLPNGGKIPVPDELQGVARFSRADQLSGATDKPSPAETSEAGRMVARGQAKNAQEALSSIRKVPTAAQDGVVKVK
jgi:hypothetical protein